MKIFLISNMYPSKNDKLFGVFVKNFKVELEKQNVLFVKETLIKGKANTAFKKTWNYCSHYLKIIFGSLTAKYDIMYVHYVSHHIPILYLLSNFKKGKWVLNAHGSDIVSLNKNKALKAIFLKVLKKVDLLVVPTSFFKKEMLELYTEIDQDKIFVSPSGGLNPKNFYVQDISHNNSELTLGFISRLTAEKGWKTFIDALSQLRKINVSFNAIIAGKGPDEEAIKKYILSNNLTKEIEFRGFVNQSELVTLYNKIDLYIFPTESESLGLTGLEAMACGTPVIASNVSGPNTYVKHTENGYLFNPKDSKQLAKMILAYINLSAVEKTKMIQNAVITASDFEQTKVGKNLIMRLETLIEN